MVDLLNGGRGLEDMSGKSQIRRARDTQRDTLGKEMASYDYVCFRKIAWEAVWRMGSWRAR